MLKLKIIAEGYDIFFFRSFKKRWGYSVPEYLWPNILFSYYLEKHVLFFINIVDNVSIDILYNSFFSLLGSKMIK
jgi:hypothetical protein